MRECKIGFVGAVVFMALSLFSIYFIDKPLTLLIHAEKWDQWHVLTYFSEYSLSVLCVLCPLILLIFPRKHTLRQRVLWALYFLVLIYVVGWFRQEMGIFAGRSWPMTWSGSGPYGSLIGDHVFGFHFWQSTDWKGSFPSGHSAVMAAVCFTMLLKYPAFKYKVVWIVLIMLMPICMVLLNYHFLGDCFAGLALGMLMSYGGFSLAKKLMQKVFKH